MYGLMLAGISESEELISKVAFDFSELNVMFILCHFSSGIKVKEELSCLQLH